ncbi:MAG: YcxB family protein [bacterium]|nr:YcxB family protein [bacterium]
MEQDIQVVTQVSEELYEHLNASSYILYRRKNTIRYCAFSIGLIICYLAILFITNGDGWFILGIGSVLLITTIVFFVFRCNTKSVARRLAKRAMTFSNDPNAAIRYTFYPDHMLIETSTIKNTNGYRDIIEVVETSKYFFLYLTNMNAHSIKKSNLGDYNCNLFRKYMEAKTGLPVKPVKY